MDNGASRLQELAWRDSGTAVTNFVPNVNYPVEFSTVPGYLAIPALITNFVTGGDHKFYHQNPVLCHR